MSIPFLEPCDVTDVLHPLKPEAIASALCHLPGLVFFDSAGHLPSSTTQSYSIIAARPKTLYEGWIHDVNDRERLRHALPNHPSPHPFPLGGLCGWVDYEGHFRFGDYPEMLIYDHLAAKWFEVGQLSSSLQVSTAPFSTHQPLSDFSPNLSAADFIACVHQAKQWIAAGDIYQVNLSQAFTAELLSAHEDRDLFSLYQSLREASPSPMAAYLHLGDTEVLSSSPESFLKISDRLIETRPIKGTRPRSHCAREDELLAKELRSSAKESAELVMITDLLRNDLGQVCEFGSVRVDEMLKLETLAQVHHLVSTIRGKLRPDVDAISALAECFPGGSITGAPKKRAMEIIQSLEKHPRGIYCGCMGWFGYNQQSSFNITIRTLIRNQQRLIYQVGAGIVADSDPEYEYEETLHKAAGIRLALQRWRSHI